MLNTQINIVDKVESIDQFLKFAYCFPMDIKDRMIEHFGEQMGNHFYNKFHYFTDKHENNFIGMIYMFGDMTSDNQIIFIELIEAYYDEIK